MYHHKRCSPSPEGRPRLEIADVFRRHGEVYWQRHALTFAQRKVMRDIVTCRTPVRGGHVDVCTSCDHAVPAYNSCRNRHCPKCQCLAQAAWIDQRKQRILPVPHFHVVFTLPHELQSLAKQNPKRIYTLLLAAAAQTLQAFGNDPHRLGGQIGVTAVLHTWTRDLRFHPHAHCIVTGGGLAPSKERWMTAKRRYLFPVKALSQLFRGKFLAALEHAYRQGDFDLSGRCGELTDPEQFRRLERCPLP